VDAASVKIGTTETPLFATVKSGEFVLFAIVIKPVLTDIRILPPVALNITAGVAALVSAKFVFEN